MIAAVRQVYDFLVHRRRTVPTSSMMVYHQCSQGVDVDIPERSLQDFERFDPAHIPAGSARIVLGVIMASSSNLSCVHFALATKIVTPYVLMADVVDVATGLDQFHNVGLLLFSHCGSSTTAKDYSMTYKAFWRLCWMVGRVHSSIVSSCFRFGNKRTHSTSMVVEAAARRGLPTRNIFSLFSVIGAVAIRPTA